MSDEIKDMNLYLPESSEDSEPETVSKYEMNITPEKTTKAEIMDVPLDLIKLDPANIRFRHVNSELKDVQLEQLVWGLPAAKKLYKQIKWSRGLQEKPVLERNGDNFVVKEGNMRIVCLRKLKQETVFGDLNEDGYEIDPVRCIVLPKEATEREEAIFLSRVHVKGKSEWGAFQKAAHIYDMVEEHGFSYDDVSDGVGVSKAKARRMKKAFENIVKYEDKYEDKNWREKYSYFYELEKNRYSKDKNNPLPEGWVEQNLDRFMEWIYNRQIEKGKEVRELPDIVKNGDAYECFKNGGTVRESLEILAKYDPAAGNKLFSRLSRLRNTVDKISESEEEKKEAVENPVRIRFLKELHKDLDELISELEEIKRENEKTSF